MDMEERLAALELTALALANSTAGSPDESSAVRQLQLHLGRGPNVVPMRVYKDEEAVGASEVVLNSGCLAVLVRLARRAADMADGPAAADPAVLAAVGILGALLADWDSHELRSGTPWHESCARVRAELIPLGGYALAEGLVRAFHERRNEGCAHASLRILVGLRTESVACGGVAFLVREVVPMFGGRYDDTTSLRGIALVVKHVYSLVRAESGAATQAVEAGLLPVLVELLRASIARDDSGKIFDSAVTAMVAVSFIAPGASLSAIDCGMGPLLRPILSRGATSFNLALLAALTDAREPRVMAAIRVAIDDSVLEGIRELTSSAINAKPNGAAFALGCLSLAGLTPLGPESALSSDMLERAAFYAMRASTQVLQALPQDSTLHVAEQLFICCPPARFAELAPDVCSECAIAAVPHAALVVERVVAAPSLVHRHVAARLLLGLLSAVPLRMRKAVRSPRTAERVPFEAIACRAGGDASDPVVASAARQAADCFVRAVLIGTWAAGRAAGMERGRARYHAGSAIGSVFTSLPRVAFAEVLLQSTS